MTVRSLHCKKGQFYLITAIILCAFIFIITPNVNKHVREEVTFRQLQENFISEGYRVINYALYSDQNVSEVFSGYVKDYASYSKTRGFDFRLLYMLSYDGRIRIDNYLNTPVTIEYDGNSLQLNDSDSSVIKATDRIRITLNKRDYTFTVNDDPVQFKALFRG